MRIYLVRHGETPWNEEMRYQGQTDVPLSEKGRKQAEALRCTLFNNQGTGNRQPGTEIRIARVYSSDLQRAYETAEIITGKGAGGRGQGAGSEEKPGIITCKELREVNYGVFEGVLLEDIKKKYMDVLQQWWRDPLKARIPDGESLEELHERVLRCYTEIVRAHQEKNEDVLIVSHGGPLRIIFMHVLGFTLHQVRSFRVDNTSLSIVEYRNGKPVLALLNDTCHLEKLETGGWR